MRQGSVLVSCPVHSLIQSRNRTQSWLKFFRNNNIDRNVVAKKRGCENATSLNICDQNSAVWRTLFCHYQFSRLDNGTCLQLHKVSTTHQLTYI